MLTRKRRFGGYFEAVKGVCFYAGLGLGMAMVLAATKLV